MEFEWFDFIILTVILLVVWIALDYNTFKNRAPGPVRIPVLGTLIQVALRRRHKPPYEVLQDLSRIYGPQMSLQTGKIYQFVVSDFKTIKEILTSDVWLDRYFDQFIVPRSFGKSMGILYTHKQDWKVMRLFCARTLRDFGFGRKTSMQSMITEELGDIKAHLNSIRESHNNIVNFKNFFSISVLNILWSMVAGSRYSYDDPKLHKLIYFIDSLLKGHPIGGNIYMGFPFLRFFTKHTALAKKFTVIVENIHQFFRDILKERRQLDTYKQVQNDFIDVFLQEIDKQREKSQENKLEDNYYTDEQFIVTATDLFIAGSGTTSNTLEYVFLFMILYPDVQQKVQDEIDNVVGRGRNPTEEDRPRMPYTEATLLEVLRRANVVPIITRGPAEDAKIGSFDVPKGTMGLLNIYDWHMNEDAWPDPYEFKPQRFLDEQGNVVNAHKVLGFGLGKRFCLGEVFAKASLFMYFTTLLQSYKFELSPNHPKPSADPELALALAPYEYHSLVTLR